MNQIINMIIRQVMRKLLNKGIDAGFDKAASMRNGRNRASQQGEIDDYGNRIEQGAGQKKHRRVQQGGQGAKQAKQAMKMVRRAGKL